MLSVGDSVVTFEFLADRPSAVPLVAGWLYREWGHLLPGASVDSVASSLTSSLHRDRVPFQVVAVLDDHVVGVAMVKEHELRALFPNTRNWLGSVFVDACVRSRGLASALVKHAEGVAMSSGIAELHLQTEELSGGLYTRLGWSPVRVVTHGGLQRLVMTKVLERDGGGVG